MFPEVFNSINSYPLIVRAINRGNLELKIVPIGTVEVVNGLLSVSKVY